MSGARFELADRLAQFPLFDVRLPDVSVPFDTGAIGELLPFVGNNVPVDLTYVSFAISPLSAPPADGA